MAVTYGFYSSLNGDRKYSAEQWSSIFDGIITDGIFDAVDGALAVSAQSTPSLTINIAKGRAWFNSTWTKNDSIATLTLDTADPVHSRYDAIALVVDRRPQARQNYFTVIKGTPAASPVPPSMDSGVEYVYWHPLAYIRVPANITAITDSYITNARGVSSLVINGTTVPGSQFVKCVLEKYELDDMVLQWQTQFYEWMESLQDLIDADVETRLITHVDNLEGVKSATFTLAGWSGDATNGYSQTATCSGMSSDWTPIMVKADTSSMTMADRTAYNKAFGIISNGYGTTGSGVITWHVDKLPEIAITVQFKGM